MDEFKLISILVDLKDAITELKEHNCENSGFNWAEHVTEDIDEFINSIKDNN